nr:uncharacterized protein LOC117460383 [Pseudochaenichthys georgianus]
MYIGWYKQQAQPRGAKEKRGSRCSYVDNYEAPVDVLQGVCSGGTGTEQEEDAGGCGNAGADGRGTRSCAASENSVGGRLDESRIGLANSAPGFAESAHYSTLNLAAVPPVLSCTETEQRWHKPRTMYMLPLGNIIRNHSVNFHCYADDTQLYLSIKPDEINHLNKIQDCLKDLKTWMTLNFLMLNTTKTEVIVLGPKNLRNKLSKDILTMDGINLASSETVRNLGVIFDQDLSFNAHIKSISRTAYFHLRNIAKIRHILPQNDAEKLVHAFVTSRLDYCNSLLSGSTKKSIKSLQLIQNAAARVLTRVRKRDHITPVLAALHWLPIEHRIEFKILLLAYKALNGQAPSYLKELIIPYCPTRALRSKNAGLLVVPRIFKSTMGARAFSYQAPHLWNQLPVCVRAADTLSVFKSALKTFLFDKAYS